MKHTYLVITSLLASITLMGQQHTRGYGFSTGGSFGAAGNKVKAYYASTYDTLGATAIDSVPGDFSNDVLVDDHYMYVHVGRGFGHVNGEDRIYKYDITNPGAGAIDSSVAMAGIQKMALYQNQLIVSREFPASADFIQILDKNNLQDVWYVANGVSAGCKGLAINGNKVYAASTANNEGRLEVVTLDSGNWSYDGFVGLDSLSAGAAGLFIDGSLAYVAGKRYDINYNFMYATVTTVNLSDSTFHSDTTGLTNADAYDYMAGNLYGNFGAPIETYTVQDSSVTQLVAQSITDLTLAPVGGGYAVQSTDYFSYGEVLVYDDAHQVTHQFSSDISGSALMGVSNYTPTANADYMAAVVVNPDTLLVDVLANDEDLDGHAIHVAWVSNPVFGTVAIENDMVLYMPYGATTNAADSFQYAVADVWGEMDTTWVNLDISVGITEYDAPTVSVYPNPAKDMLYVRYNGLQAEIEVLSLTGAQGLRMPINGNQAISVSHLVSGVYVLVVHGEHDTVTAKFIKQ